jgi:ABC-type uncharacterized transport system fused permease/ATPase subunit
VLNPKDKSGETEDVTDEFSEVVGDWNSVLDVDHEIELVDTVLVVVIVVVVVVV